VSNPSLQFLEGGGAMGERIRAYDWSTHPMGPPEHWPESLRMALTLCLSSSFPTAVYWGPELHVLYNDAWSVIPAEKHPWILGQPARVGWSDIWPIVGPQFQQALETGQGLALYEQMLPMVRGGQPRETWWNYSVTAIRNADHAVVGIFNQGNEITEVVLARRQREAELARWRELFRQAPVVVGVLRGPQHLFEFANDAYLRLVGGRDVTGKTVREALPEVVSQGFIELLDGVYTSGEPYTASGATVKLQADDGTLEERILDFTYQPMRDGHGHVDGILVLAIDVTQRARAEAALRLSNWQLGEERARLASVAEAEQRARLALRRLNDTLEAQVQRRTSELTAALEAQRAATERLRAAFATELVFQGYMDVDGTLRDANPASLAAIGCQLRDVVGKPFWDTPWFTATPGAPQQLRDAVQEARQGRAVKLVLTVHLPGGTESFLFSMRPVVNGKGEVVGLLPEALSLAPVRQQIAA
jgi:PAS domain S-box-containing protein